MRIKDTIIWSMGYSKVLVLLMLVLATSCSTTRNLPKDEVLYIGQTKMDIEPKPTGRTGAIAMEELDAALAKAPNNSLFGSSVHRFPLPLGLWTYNNFVNYKKGFGRWIFNAFAATPVFISSVNPDVRAKIGTNILHDFHFFQSFN